MNWERNQGSNFLQYPQKYLGVALTKQVKDIYTNFKTLKREIEEVAKNEKISNGPCFTGLI